jgi:anti-sigma B factor antagonist
VEPGRQGGGLTGTVIAPAGSRMNIKLEVQGDTLSIGGVRELNAANANAFRDQVRLAMSESLKNIEIDLSQAIFLDSCGLGALISLHKTACSRRGLVRLINPAIPVQQILELTRMHRIFEIVRA